MTDRGTAARESARSEGSCSGHHVSPAMTVGLLGPKPAAHRHCNNATPSSLIDTISINHHLLIETRELITHIYKMGVKNSKDVKSTAAATSAKKKANELFDAHRIPGPNEIGIKPPSSAYNKNGIVFNITYHKN